jgi:prepilin-type N-terminal cleavage/methylation domain-containing protein
MIKLSNKKSGFTLIEIMVAISIFVIVAFIVTSTLLAILDAGRRANKIRLIVDNMNFALDSMTVKMKFGESYTPVNSGVSGGVNDAIQFTDKAGNNLCYKRALSNPGKLNSNGSIQKCIDSTDSDFCNGSGVTCQDITTNEINVTGLLFKNVLSDVGSCGNDPTCQNQDVVIFVKAEAKIKGKTADQLDFQTSVSGSQSNSI